MWRFDEREAHPLMTIMLAGVVAGILVPWLVIWLSDELLFDVPHWSYALLSVGPPAISVLIAAIYRAWRAHGTRSHP